MAISKSINRGGNYKGCTDFEMPKMGSGPSLGNVGTSQFEGGLKKGATGIPAIKKSSK
jgi:hypothetical protein